MLISHISKTTGLNSEYIERVASTASHRYKIYQIDKRTGGKRTIHHPAKELKFLQRWLVDNVFIDLPVHEKAFSYRIGRNIADHAALHRDNNFLLRLDFKDFFPSLRVNDVVALLNRHCPALPPEDVNLICKIVCRKNCLTIGAPSSPILSNALLYEFDKHWEAYSRSKKITYSRYADDVYFSTMLPNILQDIPLLLEKYLEILLTPKLSINVDKTIFTSKKRRRIVTGLVITSDQKISIGRDRKKEIKALVHRYTLGKLNAEEAAYLTGLLSYTHSVEPSFIKSLETKYGKHKLPRP